jgi:DNA-binding MarR family transcriptional regulator
MMEPTTAVALRSMGRSQLIRRLRAADDRRKVRVFLTAKAKRLRNELLTAARGITADAEKGIAARDLANFRRVIAHMTANLDRVAY